MSAVNAHESASVLRIRHGRAAVARLWETLADNDIEIYPFDEAQVRAAAAAFDRYGKGINPKARLNLSTAPLTRLPRLSTPPCCSRAMTSPKRTSSGRGRYKRGPHELIV